MSNLPIELVIKILRYREDMRDLETRKAMILLNTRIGTQRMMYRNNPAMFYKPPSVRDECNLMEAIMENRTDMSMEVDILNLQNHGHYFRDDAPVQWGAYGHFQ